MSVLDSPRLRGRPVAPGDAPVLAVLFGEPATLRWSADGARPWDAARARAGAEAHAAHWAAHRFGLRLWEDAAGPAVLAGLQFCVIDGRAEIEASFAAFPDRRRKGLAGEAMAAVVAEAPQIAREVAAVVREGNRPALALLARLGFREVRAVRGARLLRLGVPA
ncbi:MAG TPA: GNAT family N-acetyltransferase [Paracoccaceae bacterium]|nr:GNAT family N-acetyltransferase [Paracoccaceae bacterium]